MDKYWFAITKTEAVKPKLHGPFSKREHAVNEQQIEWRHRKFGDEISLVFSAPSEEEARENFQFKSLNMK